MHITFLTLVGVVVVSVVVGAAVYALVVRKNPKIQADVAKAADQAQEVANSLKSKS